MLHPYHSCLSTFHVKPSSSSSSSPLPHLRGPTTRPPPHTQNQTTTTPMETSQHSSTTLRLLLLLLPLLTIATYLLLLSLYHPPNSIPSLALHPDTPQENACTSRYIYVHPLPSRFNSDLLLRCRDLNPWTDMCPFLSNGGLGRPLHDRTFLRTDRTDSWYGTHQFSLDVVFHERMKSYECLTDDADLASAVFVPFYGGLDADRYLWGPHNTSVRDADGLALAAWLRSRPEWSAMGGRDHFMVAGRVTWDFQRPSPDDPSAWGNRLLLLPEIRNMTTLVLETSPRRCNGDEDDHPDMAVPYPTYFHPRSRRDVVAWQELVMRARRRWLFAFVGGPRASGAPTRAAAIEQCRTSRRCKLLDCHREAEGQCYSPVNVMRVFGSSVFCLQPPGDTLTRRSTFDSMAAGCIPVFFGNGSAAEQYTWHLASSGAYSVVIGEEEVGDGRVRVEKVLRGIGKREVRRMREEVVRMMPRLVYGDPNWVGEGVKDAFDVAVEGVLRRVERRRREVRGLALRRGNDGPCS